MIRLGLFQLVLMRVAEVLDKAHIYKSVGVIEDETAAASSIHFSLPPMLRIVKVHICSLGYSLKTGGRLSLKE